MIQKNACEKRRIR